MTTTSQIIIRQNGSTVESEVREHRIFIDQPEENGGLNKGPKAREMFLISLGGCFIQNLSAAIKKRNADIHNVEVEIVGIQTPAPSRISAVELHVTAEYSDEKLMHKLATMAERGCLISNTVRGSVDISVSIQHTNEKIAT